MLKNSNFLQLEVIFLKLDIKFSLRNGLSLMLKFIKSLKLSKVSWEFLYFIF